MRLSQIVMNRFPIGEPYLVEEEIENPHLQIPDERRKLLFYRTKHSADVLKYVASKKRNAKLEKKMKKEFDEQEDEILALTKANGFIYRRNAVLIIIDPRGKTYQHFYSRGKGVV